MDKKKETFLENNPVGYLCINIYAHRLTLMVDIFTGHGRKNNHQNETILYCLYSPLFYKLLL